MHVWWIVRPKARHLIAFAAFVLLLIPTVYLVARNTDPYEEAERFISTDRRVGDLVGPITKADFAFWDGFDFDGSTAVFSFHVIGAKGDFIVTTHLTSNAGRWRVSSVDIHPETGSGARASITVPYP